MLADGKEPGRGHREYAPNVPSLVIGYCALPLQANRQPEPSIFSSANQHASEASPLVTARYKRMASPEGAQGRVRAG